jgi:thiamine-phosphate pyrophosphorylase
MSSIVAPDSCQTGGVSERSRCLEGARLYLVCDERPSDFVQAALRGGVEIVQLRIKDALDRRIVDAGRRMRALCAEHGALFILNDRPDLVAAVDADGVHVGQDDVSVQQARELVGAQRLVGLSTHSPAQIDQANTASVDYVGVGPVYETPTKPGRRAAGLELVRYAATDARMPFFAIGGIDAGNIGAVRDAGATRVAVVRAIGDSPDPQAAAWQLRGALIQREEQVGAA